MDKPIDHRQYTGDKIFCDVFWLPAEQKKCKGFSPYSRGLGCIFKFPRNQCQNTLTSDPKTVMMYLVGRLEPVGDRVLLEIDGVFDDYSRAVEHCKTARHFIGPIPLNETLPKEGIAWPGMHYPNRPAEEITNGKTGCDVLV